MLLVPLGVGVISDVCVVATRDATECIECVRGRCDAVTAAGGGGGGERPGCPSAAAGTSAVTEKFAVLAVLSSSAGIRLLLRSKVCP